MNTTNLINNKIVNKEDLLKLLNYQNEEENNNIDIYFEMFKKKFSNPMFLSGIEQFLCENSTLGGHKLVRESISHHLRRLFGISLNWEELLLVNNELSALEIFIQTFCSNGDLILCPAPFACPELIKNIKTKIEFYPINLITNGIQLEINDLINTNKIIEEKGRRARALFLHNPHPIIGPLKDSDIAKLIDWTKKKEIFLLIDESLASLNLWEFSSCLSLNYNLFEKNIFWIWNGAKHFSLPGMEFCVIYFPKFNINNILINYQCSPLVQFFAFKFLNDFEWTLELFEKRKLKIEKLSKQIINQLKEINELLINKIEKPTITEWIFIDLKKFLINEKENISSFNSEYQLYKEFLKIEKIKIFRGEELGMERPGWFCFKYSNKIINIFKIIIEQQKLNLNKLENIKLFPLNELKKEENDKNINIEDDEILNKVFSIFPTERWKKPINNTNNLNFIEELIKNTEKKEIINKWKINEEEFYEEAFTEEEEEEINNKLNNLPLIIDKPIENETKNILDDSNDSKRIIEIIDQIFNDAVVQIKDFSSSSTESYPNNNNNNNILSQYDSGLTIESSPTLSPIINNFENKKEIISTVGIQLPFFENTTNLEEIENIQKISPNSQMLNDSGIFVEIQPNYLSIDFPLLVPIENLNKTNEESFNTKLKEKEINNIMTINLPFKCEKEINKINKNEEEIIDWLPIENLKKEKEINKNNKLFINNKIINEKRKMSVTDWYKHFGDDNNNNINSKEEEVDVAAILNEGAEFCPIKNEKINNNNIKCNNEVIDWKPLEQIKIENKLIEPNNLKENDFYKNNSLEQSNLINLSRKSTKSEALDIIDEWNDKLIKNNEKTEEEIVNIDINLNNNIWKDKSKILIIPSTKFEKSECYIKQLNKSEQNKKDDNLIKTIINIKSSPPKKPPRIFIEEKENNNKLLFSKSCQNKQIHHKMKMRKCQKKPLNNSKLHFNNNNNIIIEHINITELEYLGGNISERIEKGERIITNISTKINKFVSNELFNKLDFNNNNERIIKVKRQKRSEVTNKIKTETNKQNLNNEEIKNNTSLLYSQFETIISNSNNNNNLKNNNKSLQCWRNIPITKKVSSNNISITSMQGGLINNKENNSSINVLHTPGTNWFISSIYKTTEYGWEKFTLKPRFVSSEFDKLPRRTST